MCNASNNANLTSWNTPSVPSLLSRLALIPSRIRIGQDGRPEDESEGVRRAYLARRGRSQLRNPLISQGRSPTSGLNIPT